LDCLFFFPPTLVLQCTHLKELGPYKQRQFKTFTEPRPEPKLEERTALHSNFLRGITAPGGDIIPLEVQEYVIAGIQGGGLALVISLPEVMLAKRTRQGTHYKIGDVLVLVNLLLEIAAPEGEDSIGHRYYIKDTTGKRQGISVHVAKLVLPVNLDPPRVRSATIPYVILPDNKRVEGLEVLKVEREGIEFLKEIEGELLSEGI
jgi:hypothetical protein